MTIRIVAPGRPDPNREASNRSGSPDDRSERRESVRRLKPKKKSAAPEPREKPTSSASTPDPKPRPAAKRLKKTKPKLGEAHVGVMGRAYGKRPYNYATGTSPDPLSPH